MPDEKGAGICCFGGFTIVSKMPNHFKAFQLHGFPLADSGFASGNGKLFLHGIYALQIREKQPPPLAIGDHNALFYHVQQSRGINFFHITQHVHTDGKHVELRGLHGGKSRVVRGSADGVVNNFLGNGGAGGGKGSDAAP